MDSSNSLSESSPPIPPADCTTPTEALNHGQNSSIEPLSLSELKQQDKIWYKLHVLIFDLRNFSDRVDSQKRLNAIQDISYIGLPYFSAEEATSLRSVLVNENHTLEDIIRQTLEERLERRMAKRVDSGDFRVCAAHDLAPIFEKAFNIRPKDLSRDSSFLDLLDSCGLKLGDRSWSGIVAKPSFGPQSKGRGKSKGKSHDLHKTQGKSSKH